jgi:hypothetical protein
MKKLSQKQFGGIDSACWVICECGHDLTNLVDDTKITICPICGRGYKVEFIVWEFEKGDISNDKALDNQ